MPASSQANRILVLGIGNILWADEGFGVRAVEEFHRRYAVPDNVTILDGGTQGLYLVNYLEDADHLMVFDAIDYGLEPGQLKLVRDDEVPRFTGAKKMSLHQTSFQEVISAADLLGRLSATCRIDRLPAARRRGLGWAADGAGARSDRAGARAWLRDPGRMGRPGDAAHGAVGRIGAAARQRHRSSALRDAGAAGLTGYTVGDPPCASACR